MSNIFEQATRNKIRFDTEKGALSVEDLWSLPLTNGDRVSLDKIAVGLYNQLQAAPATISFINTGAGVKSNAELQLKFDVVKYILDVKQAERAAEQQAKERKAHAQRIMELIKDKEDQAFAGKSLEELQAELAKLVV